MNDNWFDRKARAAACYMGKPLVFLVALAAVLMWLVLGPVTAWSDAWQLWANTFTTIVTFLMGFLILASQNRDSAALHKKLDEIIKAQPDADDHLRGIEK